MCMYVRVSKAISQREKYVFKKMQVPKFQIRLERRRCVALRARVTFPGCGCYTNWGSPCMWAITIREDHCTPAVPRGACLLCRSFSEFLLTPIKKIDGTTLPWMMPYVVLCA